MDGNRTAKRRTSKAVQKDKEMFVNFLAAPCKRKITTRTIQTILLDVLYLEKALLVAISVF